MYWIARTESSTEPVSWLGDCRTVKAAQVIRRLCEEDDVLCILLLRKLSLPLEDCLDALGEAVLPSPKHRYRAWLCKWLRDQTTQVSVELTQGEPSAAIRREET